jgi:pyruvate dehydrogenase E2 component (dihydrolipoamide acetyltransferase)
MADVVMPRLSDSMEEGTILSWLKQVGDEVAIGDELVEIETDKANMAYEADVAGTLTEILAGEGETLPIGSPIARIGDSDEGPGGKAAGPVANEGSSSSRDDAPGEDPSSAPPAAEASEAAAPSATEEAPGGGNGAPAAEAGERVKASPVARRLAKEKGVEISQLSGSGPGGRIVKADVEGAAPAAPAAEAAGPPAPTQQVGVGGPAAGVGGETAKGQVEVVGPNKLQQTVARRMSESKATAPHFYLSAEIDMSACVEGRQRLKAAAGEGSVVPSFNDMVVKACALALREHPKANASYKDGRFELYPRINVGVAVAAPGALVVPTIFDTDRKGLRQIAEETRALAGKVRDGSVTPPELAGGTFTVSNLGMFGIDNFSAVINSGQAAILAVGAITEKPVIRDGDLEPAHMMGVTLACDHRILYGAEGAEFLARVRALLEEPLSLAL